MESNKYKKIISFLENKMKDCDDNNLVINKNELKNMFDELNVKVKDYKRWILDYLQDGLLTADEQTITDIKNAINWLKSINGDPAAAHEEETHNDFSQFKPKFQVGDKVNLIDRPDVKYNILTIESVNMDEHCYVCNQGSVIDFSEEIIWRKVENDDTKPTRFDVGDFVVVRDGKSTKILKIEQADNADYECMNISDGSIETIHVENLDDADSWIWSLKDAKPGDVLITNLSAITFIYKSHAKNGLVSGYCRFYTDESVFYENSCDCICNVSEAHPATIQQANEMFSEMHRLNFDWDDNHKEIIALKRNNMNKSEPKFRIDEWIIENDNEDASPWQVVSIENDNYKLSDSHGQQNVLEIEFADKNYRLWSISDAKDGDILVVKGVQIIIYHSSPDHMIDSYCSLIRNQFISTQTTYFGRVTPASEEQYNMLFDAMDAAGYEWIPKTKTLRQTNADACFFKQGEWYQCVEDVMIDFINFDAGTAYFCSGEERLESEDGNHVWIPENSYSNFKLWSISDANDGDVLASRSEIFIYNVQPNNRIDSYCHLIGNRFIAGRWTHFGKIKPASKEQKALLFDKMKLDGYEWNETDKTLEKTYVGDFCRKKCRASQECGRIFSDENKNESNEGWSENDVKIIRGLADFVVASMPLEERPLLYMKWLNRLMDKILKDENVQSKELSKSDSNKEKLIESIKSMIAESYHVAQSNDEGEPLDENTSVHFAYGRASGLEDALVAINNFFDN